MFVGYDRGSPAYLVYHPDTKNVKRYRCVRFTDEKGEDLAPEQIPDGVSSNDLNTHENDAVSDNGETNEENVDVQEAEDPRYPVRDRKAPKHLDDYVRVMDDQFNYNYD